VVRHARPAGLPAGHPARNTFAEDRHIGLTAVIHLPLPAWAFPGTAGRDVWRTSGPPRPPTTSAQNLQTRPRHRPPIARLTQDISFGFDHNLSRSPLRALSPPAVNDTFTCVDVHRLARRLPVPHHHRMAPANGSGATTHRGNIRLIAYEADFETGSWRAGVSKRSAQGRQTGWPAVMIRQTWTPLAKDHRTNPATLLGARRSCCGQAETDPSCQPAVGSASWPTRTDVTRRYGRCGGRCTPSRGLASRFASMARRFPRSHPVSQ